MKVVINLQPPRPIDVHKRQIRYNHGKTPYQMIPLFLLAGAARVFFAVTTRKEKPYPAWNWLRGMAWSGPYACALRHLDAWYRGEPFDQETGESHLDHAICNLLMLRHYEDAYREGDDRPPLYEPGVVRPGFNPSRGAIEVFEGRMRMNLSPTIQATNSPD